MTTSRFLPIVNLIGCLLISGLILIQWLKERDLDARIANLNQQLASAQGQYETEKTHAAALQNDIVQLKESIESTVQAKKETEDAMAKMIAERDTQTAGLATASQEQAKAWETAIAERDEKIRSLNANLTATRERLDEAIAKLKAAGAR